MFSMFLLMQLFDKNHTTGETRCFMFSYVLIRKCIFLSIWVTLEWNFSLFRSLRKLESLKSNSERPLRRRMKLYESSTLGRCIRYCGWNIWYCAGTFTSRGFSKVSFESNSGFLQDSRHPWYQLLGNFFIFSFRSKWLYKIYARAHPPEQPPYTAWDVNDARFNFFH